jgi:flagellar assembly protein FliH
MFDNFIIPCAEDTCVDEVVECLETIDDVAPVQNSELIEDAILQEENTSDENYDISVSQENILEEEKPRFSQDDLDVAVASAEAKGYEKGVTDTENKMQSKQQLILENIETRLSELIQDQGEMLEQNETAAMQVAIEAICKILPTIEKDVAKKEVEAFLSNNFSKFRQESILSFSFHPDMVAEIAPKLSKLAEKNDFEGKISVHKDINLSISECRVEWKNGGVERNISENINKIEELISK